MGVEYDVNALRVVLKALEAHYLSLCIHYRLT